MEKLIKELGQAILVWKPSPDDEGIFWNLNQLLIGIRDKIPPELAPSLERFTYLQVMLRRPKGTPTKEFERQLNHSFTQEDLNGKSKSTMSHSRCGFENKQGNLLR